MMEMDFLIIDRINPFIFFPVSTIFNLNNIFLFYIELFTIILLPCFLLFYKVKLNIFGYFIYIFCLIRIIYPVIMIIFIIMKILF